MLETSSPFIMKVLVGKIWIKFGQVTIFWPARPFIRLIFLPTFFTDKVELKIKLVLNSYYSKIIAKMKISQQRKKRKCYQVQSCNYDESNYCHKMKRHLIALHEEEIQHTKKMNLRGRLNETDWNNIMKL